MSSTDQSFQTVVAVDSHPIILESIRVLLERSARYRLAATATDGLEGLQLVRASHPTVAVVDFNLPNLDGLELVRRVRAQGHRVPIVMTSAGSREIDSRLAFYAGADAYIGKDQDTSNLKSAIILAAQGHIIFPNFSIGFLTPNETMGLGLLTKRELRVHQLLAEGLTNIDIGKKLGISRKTVSTFKSRIAQKVGLPT